MKRLSKRQKEALSSALAILDGMSESGEDVTIAISISALIVRFIGKIKKGVDGWYGLKGDGLDTTFLPSGFKEIYFSKTGGLVLGPPEPIMIFIEPSEVPSEALLKRYPIVGKWIH